MSEQSTPSNTAPEAGGAVVSDGQSAASAAPEVPTPTASPSAAPDAPPRETSPATPTEEAATPSADDVKALRDELEALKAQLGQQAESAEQAKARLDVAAKAMRAEVLERLGVLEKFQGFAPDVDAYTAEGRQALEAWANDNPELRRTRPAPTTDMGLKVEGLKDKPGGWLVDAKSNLRAMKGGA